MSFSPKQQKTFSFVAIAIIVLAAIAVIYFGSSAEMVGATTEVDTYEFTRQLDKPEDMGKPLPLESLIASDGKTRLSEVLTEERAKHVYGSYGNAGEGRGLKVTFRKMLLGREIGKEVFDLPPWNKEQQAQMKLTTDRRRFTVNVKLPEWNTKAAEFSGKTAFKVRYFEIVDTTSGLDEPTRRLIKNTLVSKRGVLDFAKAGQDVIVYFARISQFATREDVTEVKVESVEDLDFALDELQSLPDEAFSSIYQGLPLLLKVAKSYQADFIDVYSDGLENTPDFDLYEEWALLETPEGWKTIDEKGAFLANLRAANIAGTEISLRMASSEKEDVRGEQVKVKAIDYMKSRLKAARVKVD